MTELHRKQCRHRRVPAEQQFQTTEPRPRQPLVARRDGAPGRPVALVAPTRRISWARHHDGGDIGTQLLLQAGYARGAVFEGFNLGEPQVLVPCVGVHNRAILGMYRRGNKKAGHAG